MNENIIDMARSLETKTIERRRDFHKYAETGWNEFRTASVVAEILTQLGFTVMVGDEVIEETRMMGVPAEEELERSVQRALSQGAHAPWVQKFRGGKTGVVGLMRFAAPGPTVALRFDMDANDVVEAREEKHRPYKDGFASVNEGAMHACGHDGHTAIGLAVAEVVSQMAGRLSGTVKLIFQPAEEGVRGAKAMAEKGVVDDVDYLIGMHLGTELKRTGQIAYQVDGFTATTKFDVNFTGAASHAGAAPEKGKNAVLAAAVATINLHAISRHSQGISRINVGYIHGGTGRNVIPANAEIKVETRGATSRINEDIFREAMRVVKAAAAMYDVQISTRLMGSAIGIANSPALAERVKKIIEQLGVFDEIMTVPFSGGSEDCAYFMERVQRQGGQAVYTMIGTELSANHHNSYFDFDEKALVKAVIFLAGTASELLKTQ